MKGELLSSYLIRSANENSYNLHKLLKNIITYKHSKKVAYKSIIFYLDCYPESIIDVDKLAFILSLNKDTVISMTFTYAIKKLDLDGASVIANLKGNFLLSTYLEKYSRRFCPICLSEKRIYKTIWQINEIDVCEKHHIKLISTCSKCNIGIPYVHEAMSYCQCPNCGMDLSKSEVETVECEELKTQRKIYDDWHFLLSKSTELVKPLNKFSKRQSLAIMLLFLANGNNVEFSGFDNVSGIKPYYAKKLFELANGKESNRRILLSVILSILRKKDLSIDEFSQTSVPNRFIKSLFKSEQAKEYTIGPCLSPWCSCYGTTQSMKTVNDYRFYCEKYILGSVCTSCYIKYGYDRNTCQWQSIDGEIEKITEIWQLLKVGLSRAEIVTQLKIGRDFVYKVFGYLVHNKLVNGDEVKKYVMPPNDDELVSKFKIIYESNGNMAANAYKMYGWSVSLFYYYLADKRVQDYLLFEAYQTRKKSFVELPCNNEAWKEKAIRAINYCVDNGIEITHDSISERMGCSVATLRRNGLLALISEEKQKQRQKKTKLEIQQFITQSNIFLAERAEQGARVTCTAVYEYIGQYDKRIRKYYRAFAEWTTEKVEKHNKIIYLQKIQKYKDKISTAIMELHYTNKKIDKKNIAEMCNISESYLRYNKELKAHIDYCKRKLYL